MACRFVLVVLALAALASRVAAQDVDAFRLEDGDGAVDVATLRVELRARVPAGAEPRLSIEVANGSAHVRFAAATGERSRIVALVEDPVESARIVALVAADLARDAPLPSPPPAASPPRPPAALPRPPPPPPPDLRPFVLRHPVAFGLVAYIGTAPTASGAEVVATGGFELSGALSPLVAIGLTNLILGPGFESPAEWSFQFRVAPFAELASFVDPRVQLFGRLGLLVMGTTATIYFPASVHAATLLAAGVRGWITDWFSVGVDVDVYVALTDTAYIGTTVPQATFVGTIGVSLLFHM